MFAAKSFAGEVAVVTGASRGIGRAVAVCLAQLGASVAALSRSEESVRAVASSLPAQPSQSHMGVACDVASSASVQSAFAAVASQLGPPSILVHAAGINHDSLLARVSDADAAAVVQTNLLGVMHTSRAAIRAMLRERKGGIVLVGSVVGALGNPGQCVYGATKAGVAGLGRSLAREVAGRGIRVNVVAPGFVDTDMTAAMGEGARRDAAARIPMGRFGRPEEVADAVAFLLRASYVTGHVLVVDGGLS